LEIFVFYFFDLSARLKITIFGIIEKKSATKLTHQHE